MPARSPTRSERFDGQHPALIERDTFDAVQKLLAEGRNEKRVKKNAKNANLLSGLLFDERGTKLFGSHAKTENGRRYRYYVTKSTGHEKLRIPAREIEPFIVNCLTDHFKNSGWLLEKLIPQDVAPDVIQTYFAKATDLANELSNADSSVQRMILPNVLARIIICTKHPAGICGQSIGSHRIRSRPFALPTATACARRCIHQHFQRKTHDEGQGSASHHRRPQHVIRRAAPQQSDDQSHLRLMHMVRGSLFWPSCIPARHTQPAKTSARTYVARFCRLAFLAPKTITAFIDGDIDLPHLRFRSRQRD